MRKSINDIGNMIKAIDAINNVNIVFKVGGSLIAYYIKASRFAHERVEDILKENGIDYNYLRFEQDVISFAVNK